VRFRATIPLTPFGPRASRRLVVLAKRHSLVQSHLLVYLVRVVGSWALVLIVGYESTFWDRGVCYHSFLIVLPSLSHCFREFYRLHDTPGSWRRHIQTVQLVQAIQRSFRNRSIYPRPSHVGEVSRILDSQVSVPLDPLSSQSTTAAILDPGCLQLALNKPQPLSPDVASRLSGWRFVAREDVGVGPA